MAYQCLPHAAASACMRTTMTRNNSHQFAVQNPFPPAEKALYSFAKPEDLKLWSVYTDATLGGSTSAALNPSRTDAVRLCQPLSKTAMLHTPSVTTTAAAYFRHAELPRGSLTPYCTGIAEFQDSHA